MTDRRPSPQTDRNENAKEDHKAHPERTPLHGRERAVPLHAAILAQPTRPFSQTEFEQIPRLRRVPHPSEAWVGKQRTPPFRDEQEVDK